MKAVDILVDTDIPIKNANHLWECVMNAVPKKHNSQMHVVSTLWINGSINP